ncbi:peptidoglycan recognition protein family protein [Paenibacillus hubeiensis]|uniref:peptidoglycan recognition protein family protein n=1 Tax=Paenibacillus hubeiensis TaxID=3077330 RepID=UPI0031BB867F
MITKGNFLLLEPSEFKGWLDKQKITRNINKLQVHHTASPNYTTRQMVNGIAQQDVWKCLEGMRTYHLSLGWSGTGQNITVLEDGRIAISLDRDLNKTPAGIKGANTGALCVEIVGNFDTGGDKMTEAQRQAVLHLYACLTLKLGLAIDSTHIVYHAWYTDSGVWLGDYKKGESSKTCPGTNFFGAGNTKAAAEKSFFPAVKAEFERIKNGGAEPMTAEETKQMNELKNKVEAQDKWIEAQKAKDSMECPTWAQAAYEYYKDYMADKTGSYDFWRQLVISYRKEKGIKVK